MRIAFITSEFSGLPGSGGIGTYFYQATICLAKAGIEVELFTSGEEGDLPAMPGVRFHHLGPGDPPVFAITAARAAKVRHDELPFDVIECAELKAEGHFAARAIPSAAFVVKVHSPSILLDRYLDLEPRAWERVKSVYWQLRSLLGAWRRGLPLRPLTLEPFAFTWVASGDIEERNAAAAADLVIVMNQEMRKFVIEHWWIKPEAVIEVPNPMLLNFDPSRAKALNISPTLGFIGRLEPRKGIVELAKALLEVLPDFPEWRVDIAGSSQPSCISGSDAGEIAREILQPYAKRVSFTGRVAPADVPRWLAGMDLCVFPSLWETFSYVALEAAAAGKAIVATDTGAIPGLLNDGHAGEIVPPGNIKALAAALRKTMSSTELRQKHGNAARENIQQHYHPDETTRKMINAYRMAMEHRARRPTV